MIQTRCRFVLIAAGLSAIVVVPRTSAQTSTSDIPEYGIRVTIPAGLPVCWAESGTHVHGVGTVLLGSTCENRDDRPAFNIWADWNAMFYASPLDVLAGHPACAGSHPEWADGVWANAIGGLKTAICRSERQNGRIEIALAAQADKWPDDIENAPYINYTVNLTTTRTRLDRDLQVVNTFLHSVVISAGVGSSRN